MTFYSSGNVVLVIEKQEMGLKITKDEVEYVAHLARLDFSEAEKSKFTSQLNDILMYVEKLNQVDTAGVEPMSHAIALQNAFRDDIVKDSLGHDLSLSNAPEARGSFFRVPKVIE
jgi:aspartyl-tRNA(Asn)/glutamyl-tRNA(Gln) amidotransferase subunit C